MKNVELCQLSPEDGEDIYEMLQRIGPSENAFNNEVNGMSYEQYKRWLKERDAWSKGDLLPDGYVRQWIYWLKSDGKPIGFGKLREEATAASREIGGNIGFAIDPNCRGRGYGDILFGLLLKQAQAMNIHEVYSTVENGNIKSRRVHEKYGGQLCKVDEHRRHYIFEI